MREYVVDHSKAIDELTTFADLPDLGFASLKHLGLIKVTGTQAVDFLQGQFTCDVVNLDQNTWCWGAHCDAKGKMISCFRLFKQADKIFLLLPQSLIRLQIEHLKKYAVFHQVNIEACDIELRGICGTDASAWLIQHYDITGETLSLGEHYAILHAQDRAIIIDFSASLPEVEYNLNTQIWQGLEILNGYPLFEAAHQGQFVPQMLNLDTLGGICLTKGCYIGQETIARMTYRGGNKRALYVLTGQSQHTHTIGDSIEMQLEKGYRKAGEVLQIFQNQHLCLLTAVMRNDVEHNMKFRFAHEDASELGIHTQSSPSSSTL